MTLLSARTLMMAVQAVDAEINRLRQTAETVEDMEPDDQEMMLAFSQAELELKDAYLDARRGSPNLPTYESLVPVAG